MELGLIGLGRMGANMAQRLMGRGHRIVAYDRSPEAVREVEKAGAASAGSIEDLTWLVDEAAASLLQRS